jgi:hypothetical protein
VHPATRNDGCTSIRRAGIGGFGRSLMRLAHLLSQAHRELRAVVGCTPDGEAPTVLIFLKVQIVSQHFILIGFLGIQKRQANRMEAP